MKKGAALSPIHLWKSLRQVAHTASNIAGSMPFGLSARWPTQGVVGAKSTILATRPDPCRVR